MIILSAIDFDFDGVVSIRESPDTDYGAISRRANRVPTLDGGAVFNDTGYSAADRIFTIRWRASREQLDQVARLVKLHRFVHVSTREGLFIGMPQSVEHAGAGATLTIWIREEVV